MICHDTSALMDTRVDGNDPGFFSMHQYDTPPPSIQYPISPPPHYYTLEG